MSKRTVIGAAMATVAIVLVLVLGLSAVQGGLVPGVLAQRRALDAQAQAGEVDVTRTILVVGHGTVSIQPDRAQVIVGVETTGDSVRQATGESAEIMEALLAALREQGVADKDIQTSGFSVWTERSGPMVEMGAGDAEETITHRVTNMVRVNVQELDNLSAILDAAIDAGANAIHGINSTIADPSRAATQARIKAIADAKAKAQELADLTGVRVGPVVSVSEVVGMVGVPMAAREALMGGGVGPISPGEMDLSVQLQVVYSIQ